MTQYNVYGIGNALVDMEFEVDEEFLESQGIEKGLMTLIDEDRQNDILDALKDHTPKRSCGGSAANTMIAVSQFGGKSFYSCKVASDETGDFYFKDLQSNSVDSNLGEERKEGTTGKCVVLITKDADRTMNTYLGITQSFSVDELIEEKIQNSEYLYIEGYLMPSPAGQSACMQAKQIAEKNGVKTAITFSDPNMVNHFKEGFDQVIGNGVDLIFCNEDEAVTFTGKATVEEAAEDLKKICKGFAITLGPKGALVYDGNETFTVATQKVKAIDSNGAGDLFAGAFLYAITHGKSFNEAATLACKASSKLVTQFGARLKKEQAQEILKA